MLRPFNPPRLTVNLIFLALLFGVYTFIGGLVVPSVGPFFPVSRINTATFLETTYIPVQVIRSLTGPGDSLRRYAMGLKPVQLEETDLRKGLESIGPG
ncbi:MAG: hypothetical protein M1598_01595 [Actinobacteria bacterium]|nr:hypothetical protein [Actinomycetota bacterium]